MRPPWELSGTVLDHEGIPVPSARIVVRGGDMFISCDQNGHFLISKIDSNECKFTAHHSESKMHSGEITVSYNNRPDSLKVYLQSTKSISGYIMDNNGNAIQGAYVETVNSAFSSSGTYSDSEGYFCLKDITGDYITIRIYHEDYIEKQLPQISADTNNFQIELQPVQKIALSLKVIDKLSRLPIQSYTFVTDYNTGIDKTIKILNTTGKYQMEKIIKLPIRLKINAANYATKNTFLNKPSETYLIELMPMITVNGKIIDKYSTLPVFNARIHFYQNDEEYTCSTYSDQEGNFSISDCISGNSIIQIRHNNYSTEVQNIYVKQEKNFDAGIFEIAKEDIQLSGKVVDKEAVLQEDIFLELYKLDQEIASSITGPDGEFSFNHLQPGTYELKRHFKNNLKKTVTLTDEDQYLLLVIDSK